MICWWKPSQQFREVSKRTIGLRHYDIQMIGGITLHQGKIAEMRTGEGKTLVATLPMYLNALAGKGVHLITVNDYLARRDARWMAPIFSFLGLKIGVLQMAMRTAGGQMAFPGGSRKDFFAGKTKTNWLWCLAVKLMRRTLRMERTASSVLITCEIISPCGWKIVCSVGTITPLLTRWITF